MDMVVVAFPTQAPLAPVRVYTVVTLGLTTIEPEPAPELHVYELAPEGVKVELMPAHPERVLALMATEIEEVPTVTLTVCVLLQPVFAPVTV